MNKKLRFVDFVDGGSNLNMLLQEENESGNRWIGKVCRPLNGFEDLDNRHIVADAIAAMIGLPLPKSSMIKAELIQNVDEIASKVPATRGLTRLRATQHKGMNLRAYLDAGGQPDKVKNREQLFSSVVFNAWIGCHDRKLEDYIIDADGQGWLIDYDLSGIGFSNGQFLTSSLGKDGMAFRFHDPAQLGLCVDWNANVLLGDFCRIPVEERFSVLEPMIDKVTAVADADLEKAVNRAPLFRQNSTNNVQINGEYLEELKRRKEYLPSLFKDWVSMLPTVSQ